MERTRILILFIALVYLSVVLFGPIYRYCDDLRYLAISKTIMETGNPAPLAESVTGAVFDGPPLFEYFIAAFYWLSDGSIGLWAILSKLFVLTVSLAAVLLVWRLAKDYGLSEKGQMAAVALFAFYPPTLFTSTSVMQDMLLVLFTLSAFLVMKKDNLLSFLKAGLLMGLMLLLKVTAPLAVVCIIASALIRFGVSKRNLLLCAAALAVASVLWAPWVIRDLQVFGTPVYHHSAEGTYSFYPGSTAFEKVLYVYVSLWGVPAANSIASAVHFIGGNAIVLEVCLALFFTPLLLIGLKSMLNRPYHPFIPLISLGLLFTLVYMSIFVKWPDSRHFIFAMPFFAVIIGGWMESVKNKRASAYVALCIIVLLFGGLFIEYSITENKAKMLDSVGAVLSENAGKEFVACKSDYEIKWVSSLFFGKDAVMADEYPDCSPVQKGKIRYCLDNNRLFLFKDATSSSTC